MPVGRHGLTCAVVREIPNDGNGSICNLPRIPLIIPPQSSRRPPRPAWGPATAPLTRFRSKLTEGVSTRRALQPSALSECGKINSRWGIPSTRAIACAKLQSDLLVAIGNPQRRTCNRIWLRGSQWSGRGIRFAFPRPLRRRDRSRRN
jgi:hypothetical protein